MLQNDDDEYVEWDNVMGEDAETRVDNEIVDISEEGGDPFQTLMSAIDGKSDVILEDEPEGMLEVRDTLKEIIKKSDYGPPLSKEIAESFEQLQVASLDRDFAKRLTEEYRVPENAKKLGVPRVQPEIFKNLLPQVRTADEQMQLSQIPLSRAIIAQAKVAD